VIRHRWRTHLKAATTEAAVVDLVRGYLGEWTAQEIRSLPGAAWPARIQDRSDIMSWMFRVGEVHARFRGDSASLARLQELLLFFTHAAVRVTQIGAQPEQGPANDGTNGNGLDCAPRNLSGSGSG
jgi:hypothetical protein